MLSASAQIWKEGPWPAGSVHWDWWINRGGKAWWEQPSNPLVGRGSQRCSHSATASETAGMTAPPGGGGKQTLCRGAPALCPEIRGQPGAGPMPAADGRGSSDSSDAQVLHLGLSHFSVPAGRFQPSKFIVRHEKTKNLPMCHHFPKMTT